MHRGGLIEREFLRQNLEDLSRRRGPDWRAGIVRVASSRDQVGAAGHGCRDLHRIFEIPELQATGLAEETAGERRGPRRAQTVQSPAAGGLTR